MQHVYHIYMQGKFGQRERIKVKKKKMTQLKLRLEIILSYKSLKEFNSEIKFKKIKKHEH